MNMPVSDACCTRMGWIEYYVNGAAWCMHVSAAPDADLDGWVTVFNHDDQTIDRLNGWAWNWEAV